MSTQPTGMRLATAFAAVLLFPFRAIERARGWRRPGLVVLYVVIALPVLAVMWRRSQLIGLPDVGVSFAATDARGAAAVPDERNAFVLYRRAAERYRAMTRGEQESFSKANLLWSRADAALRGWVAEHQEAIALLREGAERPEASLDQPGGRAEGPLAFGEKQTVILRLASIADAALFEAGRLQAEGDRAGAWALLKAVIRSSRDMERAYPTAGCRTTAFTLVQYAREPVSEWARDPKVDVALLRRALEDLTAIERLTPRLAAFYRAEYQVAEDSLANVEFLVAERARTRAGAGLSDLSTFAPNLDAFVRGEPERSRRVLRLLAANDLAWCGQPQRPEFAVPRLRIYQPDPSAPPESRALPPEELARWAESTLIQPTPPWRMGDMEVFERTDRLSLGQLKEFILTPLFTREVGRKPASPAEALRRYFPTQGDAPDRDEAEPVDKPKQEGEQPLR